MIDLCHPPEEPREVGPPPVRRIDPFIVRIHHRPILAVFVVLALGGAILTPFIPFDGDPLHTKNQHTEAVETPLRPDGRPAHQPLHDRDHQAVARRRCRGRRPPCPSSDGQGRPHAGQLRAHRPAGQAGPHPGRSRHPRRDSGRSLLSAALRRRGTPDGDRQAQDRARRRCPQPLRERSPARHSTATSRAWPPHRTPPCSPPTTL